MDQNKKKKHGLTDTNQNIDLNNQKHGWLSTTYQMCRVKFSINSKHRMLCEVILDSTAAILDTTIPPLMFPVPL